MTTFAPFTKGLTSKRTALGAAAVVLMMGLAGCNSPAPSPSSSGSSASSSSSATTASTTPTAAHTATAVYKPATAKGKAQNVPLPVLPSEGKTNTKEGAEAFVKYWYSLLSYAYETGATKPWRSLAASTCQACDIVTDGIVTNSKLGRWMTGGKITVPSVSAKLPDGSPTQKVVVQILQASVGYYDPDGSVAAKPSPASNSASGLDLSYENGSWRVDDYGLLK
ncbi:DUF6318 family protein [Pseudarthrobacter sp. J1763]|uniref:DUF6318 family protein n=1 Tax=Pseudarthrobacter sp. J1763 TaxID=3420445 RepID=UPI003D2DAB64